MIVTNLNSNASRNRNWLAVLVILISVAPLSCRSTSTSKVSEVIDSTDPLEKKSWTGIKVHDLYLYEKFAAAGFLENEKEIIKSVQEWDNDLDVPKFSTNTYTIITPFGASIKARPTGETDIWINKPLPSHDKFSWKTVIRDGSTYLKSSGRFDFGQVPKYEDILDAVVTSILEDTNKDNIETKRYGGHMQTVTVTMTDEKGNIAEFTIGRGLYHGPRGATRDQLTPFGSIKPVTHLVYDQDYYIKNTLYIKQ